MNYQNATILLVGTVITLLIITGIVIATVTINASGRVFIKTVGCNAYYDLNATSPVTAINWGELPPDSAINQTLYIKSSSNVPVNITVTTTGFQPQNAGNYIKLTADLKGKINVQPNEVVSCILTNAVMANVTGIITYSYQININAAG